MTQLLSNLAAKIAAWWAGHGTKILGTVLAVLGGWLTVLIADGGLPPKVRITALILSSTMTTLGLGTVKRGFTNTAQGPQP